MRQVIWLSLILIVGIFIGVDLVEKNMNEMQGTQGAQRAIQVTPVGDGKIQIAVLGQEGPKATIDPKKVETVSQSVSQGGTFLSELGNGIGTSMRDVTREFLNTVFAWIY